MKKLLLSLIIAVGLASLIINSSAEQTMSPIEEDQDQMVSQEQEMAEPMPQKELSSKEKISIIKRLITFLKIKAKQLAKQAHSYQAFIDKNQDKLNEMLVGKLTNLKNKYDALVKHINALIEKKQAYLEKISAQ
jgi:hypothetical protein